MRIMGISHLFLLATATAIATIATAADTTATIDNNDAVFLWSATGGGWRAMFACIGFSNVFQQAGLFSQNASSLFSGIATTSGASWFNTQLFYSQAFYNQVVLAEDPQDLYDLTIQWMQAYWALVQDMPVTNDVQQVVNMTSLRPNSTTTTTTTTTTSADTRPEDDIITFLTEFYDLILFFESDWGNFIQQLLEGGAAALGHNNTLSEIIANSSGRIKPLQDTTMLIQSALVPSSRVRHSEMMDMMGSIQVQQQQVEETDDYFGFRSFLDSYFEEEQDMAVYLGPATMSATSEEDEDDMQRYSVALSTAYIVNDTFSGFQYATLDSPSTSKLQTFVAPLSLEFEFENWESFYLYDSSNSNNSDSDATVLIPVSSDRDTTTISIMDPPFGGNPEGASLIQLAAISSAFGGPASPAAPSYFAQLLSKQRAAVYETYGFLAQQAFDSAVETLYETESFDEIAICSQWPTRPCGAKDGRFIDGGLADNPAVVINVAQYHQQEDADLTKTLKLVLTNTNDHRDLAANTILQYFETDFNRDIAPGQYVWPPEFFGPIRSTQIMGDYLDEATLLAMLEPIDDSNMTTAVLKGTTIDNPAYGVRAGQKVEVLLINLNADVTTLIAGPNIIQATTVPLAEMTRHIAANQELVRRAQDFFGLTEESNSDGGTSATTAAPEEFVATEVTRTTKSADTAGVDKDGATGSSIRGKSTLESSSGSLRTSFAAGLAVFGVLSVLL